jgi:dihydrodipicolinate synthase/N-acetylneuraminate lyase
MLLEGMFLPLTTPFSPDGRLNTNKLKDNVARYSKTPAAGLVVLSRTGQPALLSDAEMREAMRAVAEATAPEKVLVAGVARDSVVGTIELIEYAAGLQFDAVLITVPCILKGCSAAKEVLSFYRAVADSSALPVVIEAGEGDISVEVVGELAGHARIIGLVDASTDVTRVPEIVRLTEGVRHEVTVTTVFAAVTKRMLKKYAPAEAMILSAETLSGGGTALAVAPPKSGLKTRVKTVGFQVLSGQTAGILDALEGGAVGAMPPLAASAPQVCYEVLAAWKDGDPALAAEKQERLRLLARRIESEIGVSGLVAGIKYGCDRNGYFGGRPRLPMLPLTGAEREEIDLLMQGIRN